MRLNILIGLLALGLAKPMPSIAAPGKDVTKNSGLSNEAYYLRHPVPQIRANASYRGGKSTAEIVDLAKHLIDHDHILDARRLVLPLCHKPNTTATEYTLLARTYLEDPEQDPKQNNEIENDLQMAIKLDPNDGEPLRFMANYRNVQGNYKEAVHYADLALKAKQPSLFAHKDKGIALSNMGEYQKALDCFSDFEKLGFNNDPIHNYKASILQKMKLYDRAVVEYRLALGRRYQDTTVFNLVRCLEMAGKYQAAIVELDKLQKINPEDGDAAAMRARLQIKNKNFSAALADFSRAIDLEPRPQLYKERAAVYQSLNRQAEVGRDLARAKELEARLF